jgi:hypothetical protein
VRGKAYLGALLRLALSDVQQYYPQPVSLTLHPTSIFPTTPFVHHTPRLNILVANLGI